MCYIYILQCIQKESFLGLEEVIKYLPGGVYTDVKLKTPGKGRNGANESKKIISSCEKCTMLQILITFMFIYMCSDKKDWHLDEMICKHFLIHDSFIEASMS